MQERAEALVRLDRDGVRDATPGHARGVAIRWEFTSMLGVGLAADAELSPGG